MTKAKTKVEKVAETIAIKKTGTIPVRARVAEKYRLPELTAGTHVAVPATDDAVKEVRQVVANYRTAKNDVLKSKGIKLVTRIFEENGEKQIGVFAVGVEQTTE